MAAPRTVSRKALVPKTQDLSNLVWITSQIQVHGSNTQMYDESFVPGTRCFSGDYIKSSANEYKQGVIHSACHTWSCNKDASGNWFVTINVGSNQVACPSSGGAVSISGYQGTINCPAGKRFCEEDTSNNCADKSFCSSIGRCFAGNCHCPSTLNPTNCATISYDCSTFKCNNNGDCVNGKCVCKEGWGTGDCSQAVTTLNCARCGGRTCYGNECQDITQLLSVSASYLRITFFVFVALLINLLI